MNKQKDVNKNKINKFFAFILIFIVLYLILITSVITKKYNLKEGDIPKVNIKAPREVEDKLSTQAKINKAYSDIEAGGEGYSKKNEVKVEAVNNIEKFFSKVEVLKEEQLKAYKDKETDKDKNIDNTKINEEFIIKLKESSNLNLSDEDYRLLALFNKDEILLVEQFLKKEISDLYDNTDIYDNTKINENNINKAKENMSIKVNSSKLSKELKSVAINIANISIKPNKFKDEDKMEELKVEARKKIAPVMIKKDQIVAKEGEPVTKEQIEILKSLQLLNDDYRSEWYIYIILAVYISIIIFLQWIYIYRQWREVFDDTSKIILMGIVTCISLVLSRALNKYPFFIPLACGPMLMSLLINDKIALIVSVLNALLISVSVEFNIEITILAIVNAVVGATVLRKLQQRNDIIYSSLYIALINAVTTLSAGFLLSSSFVAVIQKAAFSFIGGIISGVLTIGLLPFFESTFDIVTTIKLLELSNPNNPLLKKLLMEAPGTYHHSVLVGNLAEVATEEVGGNPVLARVSAYYHDVGKIKRPYFFKENQLGNDNPHKKITPNLSTLIITSHVKDGVEFAKEYKVPKVIQDIIEQHHGTSLVKYFYITVKNSSEHPEDIKEEDFKYPGPKPKTKEAAIIMLADSVEAAVRSINEPTKGKIEEMVNNIIKDRLNEGQLDNCDLTLKDLDKIRRAFLKVLSGIYHERIEYPKDKWEIKNGNKSK